MISWYLFDIKMNRIRKKFVGWGICNSLFVFHISCFICDGYYHLEIIVLYIFIFFINMDRETKAHHLIHRQRGIDFLAYFQMYY